MIIKRDFYLNQLIGHQNDGFIKIISGLRRSGKSYLMFDLFAPYLEENGVKPDHIITIQLDTKDGEKYRNPDVCNEYVKSLYIGSVQRRGILRSLPRILRHHRSRRPVQERAHTGRCSSRKSTCCFGSSRFSVGVP